MERILRAWADAHFDIAIAWLPDGSCCMVNARYAEATGLPTESARGAGWLATLHPEDQPRVQAELQNALTHAADFETHFRLQTQQGCRRYMAQVQAVRDNQAVIGWIGLASDVDDFSSAEQLLQHLRQQQSVMLGGLAHDLLNALVPIQNAAELLRLVDLNANQGRRAIDIVSNQVQQLRRRLEDVLDTSHVSRGKVLLKKERISLTDLIQAATTVTRPILEQWKHELRLDLPDEPIWLHADSRRLGQVLSGLLNQAAYCTPTGGHVHIRATATKDQIAIEVRDGGPAVDPCLLPRLFDLYARPETLTSDRVRPGGLGLSEMRKLVELHKGTVQALGNAPEPGMTFVVTLPRATDPSNHATAPEDISVAPQRILVIGDDRLFTEEWSMMLRLAGHDVQTQTLATAHDAVRTIRPTVVSLDLGSSPADACAFAVALRAQQDFPQPLIIATANSTDPTRERRALEAGCDAVLTKPIQSRDFLRVIAAREARVSRQ